MSCRCALSFSVRMWATEETRSCLLGWLAGWLAGWLSGFTPFTSSPPHLLDFIELLFPNFRAVLFAPTSVFFFLSI